MTTEHPGTLPPRETPQTPAQLAERRLSDAEERHWLTLAALRDSEAEVVAARNALALLTFHKGEGVSK